MAPNQEKPHTTPLHSLIYSIYISVAWTDDDENCNPPMLMPTDMRIRWLDHRVHTQSGNGHFLAYIHSIMVKTAQPGEGLGGARPPPFTQSTITSKVLVYAPAEADILLPISPLPLYVLCGSDGHITLSASVSCQFAQLGWLSLPCV